MSPTKHRSEIEKFKMTGWHWFPFDVVDWLTCDDIMKMTSAEEGIYIRLLCVQWRDGFIASRPELAAKQCGKRPEMLRRWFEKWSHLFPISSTNAAHLVNPKLNEIALKKGNPKAQEGTEKRREENRKEEETTSSAAAQRVGVKEEDEAEITAHTTVVNSPKVNIEKPYAQDADDIDASAVSHAFMDAFDLKMRPGKLGYNYDACNIAFAEFLKRHDQGEALKVIKASGQNPQYRRGAKSLNPSNQLPWDWFIEKYEDMKIKMEADEEFTQNVAKKAKAAVGGHAAVNPELHTGLDAQGNSWVEDKTKL
jgi:hypothetical protein